MIANLSCPHRGRLREQFKKITDPGNKFKLHFVDIEPFVIEHDLTLVRRARRRPRPRLCWAMGSEVLTFKAAAQAEYEHEDDDEDGLGSNKPNSRLQRRLPKAFAQPVESLKHLWIAHNLALQAYFSRKIGKHNSQQDR